MSALNTGAYTTQFANGASLNGIYYFQGTATKASQDRELWRSDGTPAGTWLVKDIFPGSYGSQPDNFVNVNGTLFFTAIDTSGYQSLFKSNGTAAGTTLVHRFTDLYQGMSDFTALGNLLLFDGNDKTHGDELWVSDGTDAGTHILRELAPGQQGVSLGLPYVFKNQLFFNGWGFDANGTYVGIEPYVSDGTYAGTHLLKDIYPGDMNGYPVWWKEAGSKLYFGAQNATAGFELWTTDGTDAGTKLVKDIVPGSADSNAHPAGDYHGALYTITNPDNKNQELWRTDTATDATTLVKSPIGEINSPAYDIVNVNDRMIFNGSDPTHGSELWVSDGTSAGTHFLVDINPGAADGAFSSFWVANGWGFFTANDGVHGRELWATDGATAQNTFMVADVTQGTTDGDIDNVITVGNQLFFTQESDSSDLFSRQLWVATATTPPPAPPIATGGSISGTVYNDANNNAKRDAGEAGMAGITIYNDANNNSKLDAGEKTTTTDLNGLYTIGGLPSGSYKIRQILQSGWSQTTPANNYGWTITLATNQILAGKDFGTRQSTVSTGGSIAGIVFNDLDGDSVKDANEVGVAGITVYNDANNNSKLDSGEKTTVTNASGLYTLSNLSAGSYKIRQILQSGWIQTTPANNYGWTITLASNQQLTGKNFGTKQSDVNPPPPSGGSISGTVFNDLDGDRVKDTNELGVANITVYNDANNNSKLDTGEKTTITDASGLYSLTGLSSGSYKIRQILQSGWVQTTPTNNYGWTITLASNEQLSGKNFGTREGTAGSTEIGGKISGMIFNDLDGDGVKDSNEIGVGSGWKVYIDLDNDSILDLNEVFTTTDGNGNWMLSGLAAGTYKVRQVLQSGWKQTTPSNNYGLNVTLATNQSVSGKLFGSKKIA
ncbi:MAG TPA: SdrD B-like domain-containing protein [Tepidisphaeraceae bacterium]|nr:SdrD B-like domain-containing protein [Tepidisphaeraceae bacterium]